VAATSLLLDVTRGSSDAYVSATFVSNSPEQSLSVEFQSLGYSSWGESASFSGTDKDEVSQTKSNVTLTYTRNGSSLYANQTAIRFYKSNTLKFDAPDGYQITSITWTGSGYNSDVTTDVVTCTSTTEALSWTGQANSVTFIRPSDASSFITLSAVTVVVAKESTEKTLSSISWTGYTTSYTVGDSFKEDGTVTATYSDGSTSDVTSEASFSTPDMSSEGIKDVTVTYQGLTTTGSITVTAGSGSGEGGTTKYFVKVTSAPTDWSGEYLIVYEDGNIAFNGSLTKLDAASNTVSVTISGSKIEASSELMKSTFIIAASGTSYTIKSKSGYYIGQTKDDNGLVSSTTSSYDNTLSIIDGNFGAVSGGAYLRYNATSGQTRFRYYKSSSYTNQKAIQLYKLAE
ncbi:MAG: bacterial Ig-like domain-containing protein, partial [Candidatus Cryptobacteroides sp.]